MGKKLAYADIASVAVRMGLDPCALYAVCQVESSGDGFLADGNPKILFEGHVFWRELKQRGIDPALLAPSYPSIIHQTWTRGYYKGGSAEHERLSQAAKINREAALCSASWGMFQIMGFNHKKCGYEKVEDFVNAMRKSAELQLEAVCSFMAEGDMLPSLRALDWRRFARLYNGSGYEQNQYHIKLGQAYRRCKEE